MTDQQDEYYSLLGKQLKLLSYFVSCCDFIMPSAVGVYQVRGICNLEGMMKCIDELRHKINEQISEDYTRGESEYLFGSDDMKINSWEIFHNYEIYSASHDFPDPKNVLNSWRKFPNPGKVQRPAKKTKSPRLPQCTNGPHPEGKPCKLPSRPNA